MPTNILGRSTNAHGDMLTYSHEELEWLQAMQDLIKKVRRKRHGAFPTHSEILAEALRLGYRRIAEQNTD